MYLSSHAVMVIVYKYIYVIIVVHYISYAACLSLKGKLNVIFEPSEHLFQILIL